MLPPGQRRKSIVGLLMDTWPDFSPFVGVFCSHPAAIILPGSESPQAIYGALAPLLNLLDDVTEAMILDQTQRTTDTNQGIEQDRLCFFDWPAI